jgi:hypothetical protein
MAELPLPHDLVLVAFLPAPRNLEIARLLGWYHVPLRSAPKVVMVDWLAFYQPATFGEGHKWCVEYVAPVLGNELVMRRELFKDELDHPHAWEEYFKLQIGTVVPLPRPIPARNWKRLTFLYTTGERLLHAEDIGQLAVKDDEREVLWQALRERAAESEYNRPDPAEGPDIPLDFLRHFVLSDGGLPKIDF